jgi:uncharacterized protein
MDTEKILPVLDPVEIRVLGALIEKSKTTPEYYPMTLNALTAACNQKTSRNPVVSYDEETVLNAVNSLRSQSLVATAVGGGSRVVKYKHNFSTVYDVSEAALALLCLLFLRGPQTPGELNTSSGRLHEFSSLESVQGTLRDLSFISPHYVRELPKRPGQKEARFIHLFGGEVSVTDDYIKPEPAPRAVPELESRLEAVEKELAEVKETLARLVKELS